MKNNILEKFNLKNTVCVITGGAGLFGPKHAEAILSVNGRVALIDINERALGLKVKELNRKYSNKIRGYKLDITDEGNIKKTVRKIISEMGSIAILINNAANDAKVERGLEKLTRLENLPLSVWHKDFDVGVTGAFLMSRIIGSLMAKNKKGVILNIASDLGVIAPDQRIYQKNKLNPGEQPVKSVSYSVTKHALIGLTKYLATYWADKGVRVNSISPGGIFNEGLSKDFVAKLTNLIPMGRMADADEYKAAILFLCSDASSYMTGANLVIDGGRTVW
ncbi:MAG: SDR family oxidoreductase [Candidatus Yanofskybacteria bacterium]|nr:SDR family oxidoreductase [Candidatus Yanofskybacteria bacterium]